LPRGQSFEWKKRYGRASRRKEAIRSLQLFLARQGKDDDLTTQAKERIPHLSE
jgi:hypothetical protein